MLITLSLTVPHFPCQLAFILFCFLPPPPFSAVYRQPSRGRFKSLPASFAAPGTNYIMQQPGPFQFWRAETDRNLDLLSPPAASHLYLLPLSLPYLSLCSFLHKSFSWQQEWGSGCLQQANRPSCDTHIIWFSLLLQRDAQSRTMCAFTSAPALCCVSSLRLIPMCPQRRWADEHHLLSLCMLGEPLSTTSGAFTSTICLHLLPSGWFLCVLFACRLRIYVVKKKLKQLLWNRADQLCQTF